MSSKLKLYIGHRGLFTQIDENKSDSVTAPNTRWQPKGKSKIELNLPLNILETSLGITNVNEILKIHPDDIIKSVQLVRDRANRKLSFEIDRNIFIKDVIENCSYPEINFKPKNIVVEYSSPNIAKPFHYGHLRSTIIGGFLSNLNMFVKNNVTRLNYLGDWGTQFGFIQVGVQDLNYNLDHLKQDPIKLLYQCYVHANKLAETDASVQDRARSEFQKLEQGSEEELVRWRQILEFTKGELVKTYARLGITFDEYNSESMYSQKDIRNVIEIMRNKNILKEQNDGRIVAEVGIDKVVTVIKSDGSTLYLSRDIAAAIDRYNKYKFDRMYYVVGNDQSDHFYALKSILHKMDMPWADRLVHVKFGKIRGMSSRKGTSVFLKDILDECRELVIKRQIESPTTKVPITDQETSDVLGVSCVVINDLKQRRQRDYEFDWDKVLQVKGDTGIKLQYTHCRLHSLEENTGILPAKQCDPAVLIEDEATELVKALAKFQDILYASGEQLEACLLVTYLFHLCNHISKALKLLRIKGTNPEVASQRLLLFVTAREVLKNGISILGVKPLKKM